MHTQTHMYSTSCLYYLENSNTKIYNKIIKRLVEMIRNKIMISSGKKGGTCNRKECSMDFKCIDNLFFRHVVGMRYLLYYSIAYFYV